MIYNTNTDALEQIIRIIDEKQKNNKDYDYQYNIETIKDYLNETYNKLKCVFKCLEEKDTYTCKKNMC